MNQILVNEHDPKKKQANDQTENVENSQNNNYQEHEQTENYDNIMKPYDMQPNNDNIVQPYDIQTNYENMETPYAAQQSYDNIQTSYDAGINYDNVQQSYDAGINYDNIQQPYNVAKGYSNTQNTYDSQQSYENKVNYDNYVADSGKTIQKVEIKKVIRIFCIVVIIFSLVLGGKSIFTFIKTKNNKKDTPIVNIDKMGREATIAITTQKPIKEYSYQWNKDGEPEVEQGNGTLSIEKTIQIPNGNNILNITVTDYYGNKTRYFKQYIYDSTDITKPTINLATVGSKLKITAEDETEMSYITYSWNDEDNVRIDVSKDDKKVIEKEIEVPEGQNRLTITAVDKEENKEIRIENIIGDNKPTFDIQTDGENIIVIAKDDQGISKISITIDDVTTDSGDEPINQTEVTAKLPISSGTHTIKVTVTNINGLSETNSVTHTF